MTDADEETTTPPGAVLVAVCRERADGERRVALTPDETTRLGASGARVRIERGAGTAAGFPDESYALAGAELAADAAAALDSAPTSSYASRRRATRRSRCCRRPRS